MKIAQHPSSLLRCFASACPPPDVVSEQHAEGQNALSLTTGGFNTALGFFSLRSDMDGSLNTAVGAGTLLMNPAKTILLSALARF